MAPQAPTFEQWGEANNEGKGKPMRGLNNEGKPVLNAAGMRNGAHKANSGLWVANSAFFRKKRDYGPSSELIFRNQAAVDW